MPKATGTKHEIIDNPVIIRDYVTVVVDSKPFETKEIKTTFYDSLTDEEIKAIDSININSRLRFDPDNLDFHSVG